MKTEPIKKDTAAPYLIVLGSSDNPGEHYGGPGAYGDGIEIRCVARLASGQRPIWSLWDDVEAALQDVPIVVPGHEDVIGSVRLLSSPYQEPLDKSLWILPARFEALVIAV